MKTSETIWEKILKKEEDIKAERIKKLTPSEKYLEALEEETYWKDLKKEDKFLKKLNKAIDKKHWKDVRELVGESKDKKSDWL